MSLHEFIKKNRKEFASELRCGSCGNSLQQCGKYEIVKVGLGQGKRSEEGILCETCNKSGRKLKNVTRIIESATTAVKQVANFKIKDIDPSEQKEEVSEIEQFKKIEAESVGNIKVEEKENDRSKKQEKESKQDKKHE